MIERFSRRECEHKRIYCTGKFEEELIEHDLERGVRLHRVVRELEGRIGDAEPTEQEVDRGGRGRRARGRSGLPGGQLRQVLRSDLEPADEDEAEDYLCLVMPLRLLD